MRLILRKLIEKRKHHYSIVLSVFSATSTFFSGSRREIQNEYYHNELPRGLLVPINSKSCYTLNL